MRICAQPNCLPGQPQPGQPAYPPELLRGDSVFDAAEPVTGPGLDLDEHQRLTVDGDDVEFAVAAPPIAL